MHGLTGNVKPFLETDNNYTNTLEFPADFPNSAYSVHAQKLMIIYIYFWHAHG